MGDRIFIAKESFSTELDGVQITVMKDITRVREGHPLLDGREQFFRLLDVHYDLEQATAAPGEKRGARRSEAGD